MASKTMQPSEDGVSNGDDRLLDRACADPSVLFTPSNQRDRPTEPPQSSRLQLCDFHNLVRSSSAAIACVEFPTPVPLATDSSTSFSNDLYSSPSTCLEASDSFARMRGHGSAAEVIGKPLSALLPPEIGYRELFAEWHRRGLTMAGFEWEGADGDGRSGLMHVALYGNFSNRSVNRIWMVLRDISALARAITAVTKTERHYRALLEREEIIYLRAYADGTLSCASKTTQREFKASEHANSNIDEVLGAACHPADRPLVERLTYHRRSLSRTPLSVTVRLISATQGLGAYHLVQHPHLVGELVDAFDIVGIKAPQKIPTLDGDFLSAGFAHDANNQLMVASSAIERARLGLPPDHPSGELLDAALRSIAQCAKIHAQSLQLSAGIQPDLELIDVASLLRDVIAQCENSLPNGIAIHTSIQSGHLWAWADRLHLTQALINLVLNARDALGASGIITLSATRKGQTEPAHPSASRRPICISVSDNGPGIDATISKTIFQPFVSTKTTSKTRGLGLAMVKTLIEQNGGEVTMTTAQGLGTTFTLSLPEAEHPPFRDMTRVAPPHSQLPYRQGLRILIADDEQEVRSTLLCSLIAHGLQATAVPDSYSLIKEISRTPLTYDLVIVDDGMPGSSAIDLCKRIRAIAPNTPVIVTSGNGTLATELPYDNARRFLAKPFTLGDLTATIESVLETIE